MYFPCFQESEKYANGRVTFLSGGASNRNHVILGFRPKYLAISRGHDDTLPGMHIYNENYSTTKYRVASSNVYATDQALLSSSKARIYSIDDDGFTVNGTNSDETHDYFAIGDNTPSPLFERLGNKTITNEEVVITLSKSLSNYSYITTLSQAQSGNLFRPEIQYPIGGFATINRLKSSPITMYITTGNSSARNSQPVTVTYIDDYNLKVHKTNATSRNFIIYGVV